MFEDATGFSPLISMGLFNADLQPIEFKYREQKCLILIIAQRYKLSHLTRYKVFLINSVTVYDFYCFLEVT